MKQLYYILLPLCILTACIKNRDEATTSNECNNSCYVVTGSIIDTPKKQPLANVELRLYSRNRGQTLFFSTQQLVTTTITDEKGNYRFAVNSGAINVSEKHYYIQVFKGDYFIINADNLVYIDLATNLIDKPIPLNMTMYRPATLFVKGKQQNN